MYFIAADNCSGCSTISLWKWANALSGGVLTLQGGVSVASYVQPPNAQQPNGFFYGTITTGDVRNLGAQWNTDGTVYGVHTIGCNPGTGTVACVQWYQLGQLDSAPTLVQQGTIGSNGVYRSYPNLSVDSVGDLGLGYAVASSTTYSGISYTGRVPGDAPGTVEAETVLKAGETSINGGRYGDFSGEAVDPQDGCTLWHFEEYAKSGSVWGTWTGSYKFPSCGTPPTPDFSLGVSPSSQTVTQGNGTSYTVTVTPSGGFTGAASLSVSGLPGGAGGTFNPNPTTSTSTLTVATSATTPTGSYPLTITGTSGSLTHTASATLVVNSASTADFSLSASPNSQSVTRGTGTSYTVTVTPSGGFNGAVSLSVSGLPGRTSATFSPDPTTSTSTLRVTTNRRTPSGSYTLTIKGAGGGLTHTTQVTLVVR
jgi:hypothetical protein